MKQVHLLAIIGQPEFVDGKSIVCPHCQQAAKVRTDGSAYCVAENKAFSPEHADGELFAMRSSFDVENGIEPQHRLQMMPGMLLGVGYGDRLDGKLDPVLSPSAERFARGQQLSARHHNHA